MQFSEAPQIEIVAAEEDISTYLKEKIIRNSLFMTRISPSPGWRGILWKPSQVELQACKLQ
jgi:hypothetical protein